jgi:hypothetical protein
MPFASELRDRLLLWCDRRCCLCRKVCDVLIELHHIEPEGSGGSDDEDNAIPLCFDCHARVGHYNDRQPRGNKFRPSELKARREQVYEESTRHLVPAFKYRVLQGGRELPDIGFCLEHPGDAPWAKVLVTVDLYVDGERTGMVPSRMYQGEQPWNLNPGEQVHGHFPADPKVVRADDLRAGVRLVVSDVYARKHTLLPVTYVYSKSRNEWWLDPVDPVDSLANRGAA